MSGIVHVLCTDPCCTGSLSLLPRDLAPLPIHAINDRESCGFHYLACSSCAGFKE